MLLNFPQCIVAALSQTHSVDDLKKDFLLGISGSISPKLHSGNVINDLLLSMPIVLFVHTYSSECVRHLVLKLAR